jgi:hypothetical protein
MTLEYYNNRGTLKTVSPTLNQNPDVDGDQRHGRYIVANSQGGYYNVDGTWTQYGPVKWLPAEEDYEMFMLYLVVDDSFETGAITFAVQPSCGADARPEVTTWTKGYVPEPTVVNIAPDQPQEVVAPEPTFNWSDQSFTMEAVCEGHDVVLMIGEEVVSNPYTVVQTYEEQEITFTAYTVANAELGETDNSATVTSQTVVVPAKALTPSNKPVITVTPGENAYTVEATGTGTVVLYLDNGAKALVTVDNPYVIDRPAYGEADLTLNFKASNLDSDEEIQYEMAWEEKEVVVPAKDPTTYQTPDPVITVDVDNDIQVVTITATGEGNVTLKVTGANGTVGEASGNETCSVEIPFGDAVDYVNAYATATATGYDVVTPGDATETMIEIPAKPSTPTETTLAPAISATPGNQSYTVTVTNNADEPNATIMVSVDGGEFVPYTGPITFTVYGQHTVVAYAVAQGKNQSSQVSVTVTVDENTKPDPTAVNELNGEKTVAGVRYFNMAGQEMQEANGMTIVVTTYTDGTTSAVKVMK